MFSNISEVRENSKEIPCKNEPFLSIESRGSKEKPISSKTHFWEIDHALRNLENSRKTHFIENPFLREHTVPRYKRFKKVRNCKFDLNSDDIM